MINNVKLFECDCKGEDTLCLNCKGVGVIDWVKKIIPTCGMSYELLRKEIQNIIDNYKIKYNDTNHRHVLQNTLKSYIVNLETKQIINRYEFKNEFSDTLD